MFKRTMCAMAVAANLFASRHGGHSSVVFTVNIPADEFSAGTGVGRIGG
jgi:hypothetical protein